MGIWGHVKGFYKLLHILHSVTIVTSCYTVYILLHGLHSVTRVTFCYTGYILLHFRQPNFIDLEKATFMVKQKGYLSVSPLLFAPIVSRNFNKPREGAPNFPQVVAQICPRLAPSRCVIAFSEGNFKGG